MSRHFELETANSHQRDNLGSTALSAVNALSIATGRPWEDVFHALEDQAVYYIKKLTVWAEVVVLASCILTYMISGSVVKIAGMEPEAAALCLKMVLIITIVKPIFWSMSFIPAYGFRAAGDVRFTMITSSLTMWFCRVVGAIFMIRVLHLGILSVWIGMFMDWAVRSIIYRIHFVRGNWLKNSVIE